MGIHILKSRINGPVMASTPLVPLSVDMGCPRHFPIGNSFLGCGNTSVRGDLLPYCLTMLPWPCALLRPKYDFGGLQSWRACRAHKTAWRVPCRGAPGQICVVVRDLLTRQTSHTPKEYQHVLTCWYHQARCLFPIGTSPPFFFFLTRPSFLCDILTHTPPPVPRRHSKYLSS